MYSIIEELPGSEKAWIQCLSHLNLHFENNTNGGTWTKTSKILYHIMKKAKIKYEFFKWHIYYGSFIIYEKKYILKHSDLEWFENKEKSFYINLFTEN